MSYLIIIELGLYVLLIYTPLAYGAVTEFSITFIETLTGVFLLAWIAYTFSKRKHISRHRSGHHAPLTYYLRFTNMPCLVTIGLFFGLLGLQLLPLPVGFVKIFSPETYRVYAEAAVLTDAPVPNWLPLSVCRQASETELAKFFVYLAVFFLILNTIRTPRQIRRIVSTIIVTGFFEALYGLSQLTSYSEAHGTFVNKNHFAGYLEMVLLLAFGVFFTRFEKNDSSRRQKSSVDSLREQYPKAFLFLLVVFVLICALILSGSRGGMVGFACGLLVFALLVNSRHLLRRWIVVLLVFLPLAFGIATIWLPEPIFKSIGKFTGQVFEHSWQVRWEIWKTLVHISADFPVVGSGLGTFSHLARRYQTFRWGHDLQHSESDFLQLLSETGILGTIIIVLMVGIFFYRTIAQWEQCHSRWAMAVSAGGLGAMVSILVHGGVDFNLHIPSNALLFTVIAALTYVTAHIRKDRYYQEKSELEKTTLGLHPVIYRGVIFSMSVIVVFYIFYASKNFYAFSLYQNFSNTIATQDSATSLDENEHILPQINTAIRYDKNQAEYYYTLGSYLFQNAVAASSSEYQDLQRDQLRESEAWLKQAILLDPANPWYYYEMARLSSSRPACLPGPKLSDKNGCPATQYFLAALKNYPKSEFLREQIIQWYYAYDQEAALQFVRKLRIEDQEEVLVEQKSVKDFAEFLYALQMDYESDLEFEKAENSSKSSSECQPNVIFQGQTQAEQILELGNDDGSAEWNTRLTSEELRIKKVICLPHNIAEYRSAALKIFMNRGGYVPLHVNISLNDHQIPVSWKTLPYIAGWYEFPFDITLLDNKSTINVYIRSSPGADARNAFQIWGDRDTPTTQSVFNFQKTDDLSPEKGKQTGEYLIRLGLKK